MLASTVDVATIGILAIGRQKTLTGDVVTFPVTLHQMNNIYDGAGKVVSFPVINHFMNNTLDGANKIVSFSTNLHR